MKRFSEKVGTIANNIFKLPIFQGASRAGGTQIITDSLQRARPYKREILENLACGPIQYALRSEL